MGWPDASAAVALMTALALSPALAAASPGAEAWEIRSDHWLPQLIRRHVNPPPGAIPFQFSPSHRGRGAAGTAFMPPDRLGIPFVLEMKKLERIDIQDSQ